MARKLSSSAINWSAYGRKMPFSIQQPPGNKNALGELKFLFPNAHNIYMHDTPNRELFDEAVRDFSHGCVRVQNPAGIRNRAAGLGRGQGRSRYRQQGKPDGQAAPARSRSTSPISPPGPTNSGKIQYFDDIYGRDEAMENALERAPRVAQR